MSQRATLVDHDELADLQDEPSVYSVGSNHDGQPSPILQVTKAIYRYSLVFIQKLFWLVHLSAITFFHGRLSVCPCALSCPKSINQFLAVLRYDAGRYKGSVTVTIRHLFSYIQDNVSISRFKMWRRRLTPESSLLRRRRK